MSIPKPARGEQCLLAHDLNNQLAVILGRLDILADRIAPGSDVASQLAIIRATARHMAEHIQTHQCQLSTLLREKNQEIAG